MIVSAHDGYPRLLDSGADFIEIDIRRNANDAIILAHDEPRPNETYPTLDEVLNKVANSGLHLDLKEAGFETELMTRVLRRLRADKIVVTPDFEESVRAIKVQFPEVRVSPIDFVAVDRDKLDRDELDRFGGHKPIWVWTVDDKRTMKRYMEDARIEAIITNRPDVALKLRKARS